MREYRAKVAGDEVKINVVERAEDLESFRDFVRGNLRCLAVDSETTGLKIYTPEFQVRLVQFGNRDEAYVIPVEYGGQFVEDVIRALHGIQRLVLHNASFDLQVFDQRLGVKMEDLWPKTTDTKIIGHLVDPRGQEEGGIGLKLENVTAHYIDREVAEGVKTLMARLAKAHKTTKAKIWPIVPIDDPDYNLYAGMDPILAARLSSTMYPLVPRVSKDLIPWEHEVAEVCSYLDRQGFLLDVDYTQGLSDTLRQSEQYWTDVARETYGIESVNATEQVADALQAAGVRNFERTANGNRKVDKKLLEKLIKADEGDPASIAHAVTEAKRTHKWRETWVDTFLANRDEEDRCHASINPLRARTARMSITGIPAQTLPSSDAMIRRCFLADEGHKPGSIDYKSQELRVLAFLSGDRNMIQAFANGQDLHLLTARTAFGDHIQKEDVEREKYAKTANFQKVYGGGAKSLAGDLGIPLETAQAVHKGFDKAYPAVPKYSKKLQAEARSKGYITTPTGRRLPVDSGKEYSALNYMVQSTSRDVTCRGLLKLHRAGFTPYLRLPVHDEVVASLPAKHAEWGANQIGELMKETMGSVEIGTDPEVGIRSWGSLYGAEV